MKQIVSAFFTILMFSSCSSLSKEERLTLKSVMKLYVGQTSRDQARAVLGAPDKILLVKDIGCEFWLYLYGNHNGSKTSLCFDPEKNVLASIGWYVKEADPEVDLKVAQSHFPSAVFKRTPLHSDNPHVVTFDASYGDEKLGVDIEYNEHRKMVHSISWHVPGAQPVKARTPAVKYEL